MSSIKSKFEDLAGASLGIAMMEEGLDRLEKMMDKSIKAQLDARKIEQDFILKLVAAGAQNVIDGQKVQASLPTIEPIARVSPVPQNNTASTAYPTTPMRDGTAGKW